MSEPHKPRALLVVTLFSIGGATETVVSLARGLKDHGFDVAIVSGPHVPSEGDMLPAAKGLGLDVVILPGLVRSIHIWHDLLAFFQLVNIIKKGRFDVVHTHSSKAGVLGRFAAWTAGAPVIVHTIHGVPFHPYMHRLVRQSYILVERLCAKISNALVAVSHRIVQDCLQYGVGRKDQFVVIRSSFKSEQYLNNSSPTDAIRKSLGVAPDEFLIGKISRLSDQKGHAALLQVLPAVFRQHPRTRVVFLGDGEIRDSLMARVQQLSLGDRVIFAGAVHPSEIVQYIAAMDLVVHVSLHEGLPRVLPQALALGKPVISYNLDGAPEVIRHGIDGLLVPPLDDAALCGAISTIIEQYPHFSKNCESGRAKISEQFSEARMVADTVVLYRKLLASGPAPPSFATD